MDRAQLLGAVLLSASSAAVALEAESESQPGWLEITLNGTQVGTELSVCTTKDCWLPRTALAGWRVQIPDQIQSINTDGTELISIAQIDGISWQLNRASQSLALSVSDAKFTGTARDLSATSAAPLDAAPLGSFLNYSLNYLHAPGENQSSAYFEWGVFGRLGVFTSTAVLSSIRGFERLDSTWTFDRPETMQTISVGDNISDGGQWGRSRRFGGLQWRSNFAVRPDLVTFPLPGASGSSAVPASVDIYVDEVLRSRTEVPAGPFEFNNLPVTTGSGEVEMVVRDAYGREQRVRLDYFVSPQLLNPGLRAFEYSIGLQRRGYGDQTDYQDVIAVVTERRGLSNRLTGEWHSEITRDQVRSGFGAIVLGSGAGLYSVNIAGSTSKQGSGWMASGAYEWRGDTFFGSAGVTFASDDFDAASLPDERSARRRLHASLGWSPAVGGSLSLSYLRLDRFNGEDFEFASLGYQFDIGRFGHLQFSASHTRLPMADTAFSVHYALPLGARDSASVDYIHNGDGHQQRLNVQRSTPPLGGFGYRMALQPGDGGRFDFGISTRQQHANYTIELSRFMKEMSYRAEVAGGLAWIGGDVYAGQPLRDSFAVVSVDDFPDVGIYADHRLVAHTNAQGRALVPGLRAYETSRLGIEHADLPIDARIDAVEVIATPPSRSGLLVNFPVLREQSAQLQIVLDDQVGIPATAIVTRIDTGAAVALGMDGLVWLSDIAPGALALRVQVGSAQCEVAIHVPAQIPPGLDLGAHTCAGIQR